MSLSEKVAWSAEIYEAERDAREWLARSPRSGAESAPVVVGEEFVRGLADALTSLPFATWNFGDSIAFEALLRTSEGTGDERWASFIQGWGRAWATRSEPFVRLDATVPGRALVQVAERYGDFRLLAQLRALADYLLSRPKIRGVYELWQSAPLIAPYGSGPLSDRDAAFLARPPACVCVDALHFDPPFLVALGTATDEFRYVDEGIDQAARFVDTLQRSDGLFDHFLLAGVEGTFGSGWGRGQGWALLGLLDVIETYPVGYESARVTPLREATVRLVEAMVGLQRPDGHWPVVVTDPGSGDEYSTTAFMIAGFSRAARLGLVDRAVVRDALQRATAAFVRSFDRDLALRNVSAAVYASTVPEHYAHVPVGYVVPWGQGPALMAAWEIIEEARG
ncbi:glycoside hydrolase family 88 protein [Leifsonia sp. AG29]|uniref:glycoside hydrolase family 88 protein n=1 Tax=Leifsonia sp. AG29 TaxID=2598860 RepID=UPI00131CD1BF|nr:glycoside hydrolase family 88 protein [Leifsonia sp. AG29]